MSRFRSQVRFSAALEAKIYDFFVLLGVSKNELRYMKPEKKISLLFLCVAMLIIAGCRKDDTPAEVKTPVGFRAMSQAALVKSGATESLSKYHKDFGVWGIATEAINHPYILWKESAFEKVERIGSSDNYAPVTDAYWLTGYTYKFLALAPYESGVSALSINKNLAANSQSATPSISFKYDMSEKYNPTTQDQTPNYTYDLLGAVASHTVKRNEIPASQDLVFWHLFSRIIINVEFVGATGHVNYMRLYNIDSEADYTISFGSDNGISVDPVSNSQTAQANISFTGQVQGGNILHILPQSISDWQLFLDFTITENGHDVAVNNFEVNLSKAKESQTITITIAIIG